MDDFGGRCAYIEVAIWEEVISSWAIYDISTKNRRLRAPTPYFNAGDAHIGRLAVSGQRQV